MSTTYEEIYNRFTPLIEDVKMLSLSDQDVLKMMKEWLIGATGDYIKCTYDLEDRDDDNETFNITLPEFDQKILARYMVTEWLRPQLNSTLITRQFFGGNEEKLRVLLLTVRCIWKHCSVFLRICWNALRVVMPKRKDEICLNVMA